MFLEPTAKIPHGLLIASEEHGQMNVDDATKVGSRSDRRFSFGYVKLGLCGRPSATRLAKECLAQLADLVECGRIRNKGRLKV